MARNWKGERDWWLDHFYQRLPGARRRSSHQELKVGDYMAIPLPTNVPTPLAWPCLIWRWALDSNGYGRLGGKGAHVMAYGLSRGKEVGSELSILHLCHRPFCAQPAHLYEGTAKQNSEDRHAVGSELHTYRTWEVLGDRWNRATTDYYWDAPLVEAVSPGFVSSQTLECPHRFVRPAGGATLCANCSQTGPESFAGGHREPCTMPDPVGSPRLCRCQTDPCCCKSCLLQLLGPAQLAYERAGNTIDGPLNECIPALIQDNGEPLSKEKAQRIREHLTRQTVDQKLRSSRNLPIPSELTTTISLV